MAGHRVCLSNFLQRELYPQSTRTAARALIQLLSVPSSPFPVGTRYRFVVRRSTRPAVVLYCWTMDKRLAKRHKRQVARAKLHSKTSEPDVRTHEQIEAAREASRP